MTDVRSELDRLLADPTAVEVAADECCDQVDRLAGALLAFGHEDVAEDLLVAHVELGIEEEGIGHAHLIGAPTSAIRRHLASLRKSPLTSGNGDIPGIMVAVGTGAAGGRDGDS